MSKEKKEKGWGRFKKWCNDNIEVILFSGLTIGAGVVAYMFGKDIGYAEGLNEFRGMHINTVEDIIDDCGHEAAFIALDSVRSNADTYKELLDNPDNVICEIGKKYYDSDFIKKLRSVLYDD